MADAAQGRQIPRGGRAARRRGDAGRREPSRRRTGRRARRSVHREQQRPIPRLSAEPQIADRIARRAHRRVAGYGSNLQSAAPGSGYQRALVDPASGALLSLYVERPGWCAPRRGRRSRRLRDSLRRRSRRAAGGVPGHLSAPDALSPCRHSCGISTIRSRAIRSAACCWRSAATASASRTRSSPSCAFRRPCFARCRASNDSSRSCGWPSRPVRCSASSAPSSA